MGGPDSAQFLNYNNEPSSTNNTASKTIPSPARPAAQLQSPEAAKIEAAREILDPRELLGGNFTYRNPKYTAVDPALKDHAGKAISNFEAKNFEKSRDDSIRAGSKIGTCDLKAHRSDKYCEECGPDSKPCKCYEGMLKAAQDYEMRSELNTGGTSTVPDKNDLIENRIQETGKAVEVAVQRERKKKIDEIKGRIADAKTLDDERKELSESLDSLAILEKQSSADRGFYIRKVLLNGIMNTKTPACVLNKGRYGIGAKRDPATDPEWIYPGDNYCHQFDLKPDEPFESLSKQDAILLRLALKTMEGLEKADEGGSKKISDFETALSPSFKISDTQICSSRKLCELKPTVSNKNIYYRIFSDETQDSKVRQLFDGETENTIARTFLRCFGPREWGGMSIRLLEYLQGPAEACENQNALYLRKSFRSEGFLASLCKNPEMTIKRSESVERNIPESANLAFKKRNARVFPFDRQKTDGPSEFCQVVAAKYSAQLDILRAAIQLNPGEICSDKQLKLYEKPNTYQHKSR